jgi:hypothetical protein
MTMKPIYWGGLVWLALVVGGARTGVGEEPGAEGRRERVPVEAEVTAAKQALRDAHSRDFSDVSQAGKRRLAGILWRDRGKSVTLAAEYARIMEVRDLAIAAGEVELSMEVVAVLCRRFDVEADAARAVTMQQLVKQRLSPRQSGELARMARALVELRLAADDFEGAVRMAGVGEQAARQSGDAALAAEMAVLDDFCRDVLRQAPHFRSALARLAEDPMDASASQRAGEFLITAKQEWGRALVMLSRGTDARLRAAAAAELGNAKGSELLAAADTWYDWSRGKSGPARSAGLSQARKLFELAYPDLSGSQADEALTRVAEVVRLASRPGQPVELASVRAARPKLGDAVVAWVEGLKFGELRVREDGAELVSSQVILDWTPRLDDYGELLPMPGEGGGGQRLTYRVRFLCTDASGTRSVLEREGRVTLRDGDKPIRLSGPENKDIRRQAAGRVVPTAAFLRLEIDGVPVAERIWPSVGDRAWWLEDSLVVRR